MEVLVLCPDENKDLESLREKYAKEFSAAMHEIYTLAPDRCEGYKPTAYLVMLNQYGAYETATRLIEKTSYSSGFEKLWQYNALDISVEALVAERYSFLFPIELVARARKTLEAYKPTTRETHTGEKA